MQKRDKIRLAVTILLLCCSVALLVIGILLKERQRILVAIGLIILLGMNVRSVIFPKK